MIYVIQKGTHTVYIVWKYLWLREHVQTPGAHLAISGDADQVVGILGSNHIHTVNWVLQRKWGNNFTLL